MRDIAPDIALFGGMAAVNMYEELEIGVVGNVPDACLTDVLVDVYDDFVASNLEQAQKTFSRYRVWLNYLHLHRMSNVEVEKETLRQRGVIKSAYTRLPRGPLLTAEDKAELNQMLRDLDLL
jgi:dihydrodipicolinate synthase/N-acetylneuraminate lyase